MFVTGDMNCTSIHKDKDNKDRDSDDLYSTFLYIFSVCWNRSLFPTIEFSAQHSLHLLRKVPTQFDCVQINIFTLYDNICVVCQHWKTKNTDNFLFYPLIHSDSSFCCVMSLLSNNKYTPKINGSANFNLEMSVGFIGTIERTSKRLICRW